MNRWLLLPLLASVAALWLSHGYMRAPSVSNDGTQYLDAAEHLRAGECLCTTVAHFDEQLNAGRLPVPFTHFAPGYSLLIAGLSVTGISFENAGYLISAAAFAVTLLVIWEIGLQLETGVFALLLVSLLWLTNAQALAYAAAIAADMPLTAVFCVTVALVVRDLRSKGPRSLLLPAIGLAASAAYWVKYAGLFVIPMAILYLAWRAWRTRESRAWALAGILAALLFAAPIPIHNIFYEGSWKGGFQAGAHHTARFAVTETVKAVFHMLFGAGAVARLDFWAAIAVASLIGLVVFTFRNKDFPRFPASLLWIALFVAAFSGGIAIAAMQSIAGDLLRYNFPIYPVLLVAAATFFKPESRVGFATFSVAILSILVIQSRSITPASVPLPDSLRLVLNQRVPSGESMREWMESHVAPTDVMVAVDGQAVHYVLRRPVISVLEPIFSDRRSDEASFRTLMRQYRAPYLVVFPGWQPDIIPEQQEIAFLQGLATGVTPPWLRLAARAPNVAVFECAACR